MNFFYCPSDGFVGDVMPFYWEGKYHAFYLKAPLPPRRHDADSTPYAHVVSADLVHWEEWPLVIEPGPPGSADAMSCWTGSVIERDGTFHLFYTGNPGTDQPQTVCRATSTDLRTWTKDPRNPIIETDTRWYEPVDWRDPFPFWNEEAGEYWMLLAAREKDGPSNRRGCIALMTSPDLDTWVVKPPFWSPRLYYTHECPDLFRWNDQWVLVYSTFTERNITHYRVSESLAGPWLAPTNDSFDDRAYYAAKTASDGSRRLVFGWNPTREGETDTGKWQWGGSMVVHELHSDANGDLIVAVPPEVDSAFSQTATVDFQQKLGDWAVQNGTFAAQAVDSFAACLLAELPQTGVVQVTVTPEPGTRGCGLFLRADAALEHYYQVRWEPGRQRVVFDRWPRPGDEPFMLERPLAYPPDRPLTFKVFIDETIVVAYVNDTIALNCRAYDHRAGSVGLFVAEGAASFADFSLRQQNN